MTGRSDDLERTIAALEAELQRLKAGMPASAAPPAPSAGPTGTANVSGTQHGVAAGVNYGTIQAFFGASPPADGKELLDSYLSALVAECEQLRLYRLTGRRQSGAEQGVVPPLRLQAVYTSLTTDGPPRVLHERRRMGRRVRALLERLDRHPCTPDVVPPERVREPQVDLDTASTGPTDRWDTPAARQAIRQLALADHDDTPLVLRLTRPELAIEAIYTQRYLVLLGEPGAGKSTVLRYLIVSLAEALRAGGTAGIALRGWESVAPLPIPLFCPLGRVARALDDDPDHDLDVLVDVLLRPVVAPGGVRQGLRETILQAWRSGGALLCLDGLDEVSSVPEPTRDGRRSRRERLAEAIGQLAVQVGRAHLAVTCRTRPYTQDAAWQLPAPWVVRTIEPFALGQVRFFVPTWYVQTCAAMEAAKYAPDQARTRAANLVNAIISQPGLQAITASPLLLTMLALLHYNQKQLPDERADVYEELVKLLLERWEGVRSSERDRREETFGERLGLPHLRVDHLRPALHALAFAAHQQHVDGRGVVPEPVLQETLDRFFRQEIDPANPRGVRRSVVAEKTERFTELLVSETGLVQPDADGLYVLPHLTFEEYLAACHLAGRGELTLAYEHWCAASDRWREALLLMVGRLRQQEKFSDILAWLTLLLAEKETPAQWQRDALLAAACYEDLGRRRYLGRYLPEPAVLEIERKMQATLRAILERPALPLAQRVEAGAALGRLGDPRVPVTAAEWRAALARRNEVFGAPAGYWCYVRPATYRIGGWGKREKAADIDLLAFWIARFPITVVQYAPFVTEGYGNKARRWWTPEGWKWKQEARPTQPWGWNEAPYDGPNQPVIGVSWYEATAFCAWLTDQLRDALPASHVVRLPTEAEWEAAAAYDGALQRRPYPWGDEEPTPERAIYDASTLGRPAPIGCCPAGAAACDALDMAGTVWEVTASSYQGYPEHSGEVIKDFTTNDYDVPWRGGSHYDNSTFVRCGARVRGPPDDSIRYDGFRVVVAPRLAQ